MLNSKYSEDDIIAYNVLYSHLCSTISNNPSSYNAALKSIRNLTKNNLLNADIEQSLIHDCTTFYISTLVGSTLMQGFTHSFEKSLRGLSKWL